MTELTANDKDEFILTKLIRITNSGELVWKHEKGERLGVWRGCKYYIIERRKNGCYYFIDTTNRWPHYEIGGGEGSDTEELFKEAVMSVVKYSAEYRTGERGSS